MGHDDLQQTRTPMPRRLWIYQVPLWAFLISVGAWMIHDYLYPPPPPTPAEVNARIAENQAEQAAEQAQRAVTEQKIQLKNELCRLRPLCRKYAQVRQECAVAGSYNKCLEIRLGDENVGLIGGCTDDGKLAYAPPDMPNSFECFFRNLANHKPLL